MQKIKRLLVCLGTWQHFGLLVLVLASFSLHIATITQPNGAVFDEEHYVVDARRILNGEGSQRGEHPPLARLIIAGSMKVLGDSPWGWRLPAVILSTIGLALFYDICCRLGASQRTAFLATFLLTFENLSFIHGGLAMLDIYVAFFTILAFWLYLRGWWELAAASVALAALSKFSGLLSAVPIGLHWFLIGFRQKAAATLPPGATRLKRFIYSYGPPLRFVLSMLLIPVVFILAYWLLDYAIWQRWVNILGEIWQALKSTGDIKFSTYIMPETGLYKAPLPSHPWEWILSPTGSFYAYGWLFDRARYTMAVLSYYFHPNYTGILSPTIWFASMLTIPFTIWRSIKKNNAAIFVLCWFTGTWALWVPLSIISDRASFIFYLLPAIGALCLGAGLALTRLMERAEAYRRGVQRRSLELLVAVFVLLHLAAFVWLTPVRLWISIPTCILLLVFTLEYLGYNWRLRLPPASPLLPGAQEWAIGEPASPPSS